MKQFRMHARIVLFVMLISGMISGFSLNAQAKNENSGGALLGEIVYLGPKDAPTVIGVTFADDGADYYFTLGEDLKVVNKKNLDELQLGDTVELTYRQDVKKTKDGKEKIDRIAAQIRFVKPAKKDDTLGSE